MAGKIVLNQESVEELKKQISQSSHATGLSNDNWNKASATFYAKLATGLEGKRSLTEDGFHQICNEAIEQMVKSGDLVKSKPKEVPELLTGSKARRVSSSNVEKVESQTVSIPVELRVSSAVLEGDFRATVSSKWIETLFSLAAENQLALARHQRR